MGGLNVPRGLPATPHHHHHTHRAAGTALLHHIDAAMPPDCINDTHMRPHTQRRDRPQLPLGHSLSSAPPWEGPPQCGHLSQYKMAATVLTRKSVQEESKEGACGPLPSPGLRKLGPGTRPKAQLTLPATLPLLRLSLQQLRCSLLPGDTAIPIQPLLQALAALAAMKMVLEMSVLGSEGVSLLSVLIERPATLPPTKNQSLSCIRPHPRLK